MAEFDEEEETCCPSLFTSVCTDRLSNFNKMLLWSKLVHQSQKSCASASPSCNLLTSPCKSTNRSCQKLRQSQISDALLSWKVVLNFTTNPLSIMCHHYLTAYANVCTGGKIKGYFWHSNGSTGIRKKQYLRLIMSQILLFMFAKCFIASILCFACYVGFP